MKIVDLNFVTNQDFKPFYQVPIGSTFQLYILRHYNKYGQEEYASNFLKKEDLGGGFYCGSEEFDKTYCTITQTHLVRQVSDEDSHTYTG